MITTVQHRFTSQPRPRTITETIVIHHTASHDVSAAEINRWHQNNNPPWLGIGYHFVIRQNGNIETGRPHDTIGAHAGANVNTRSIGIAVTGNFSQPSQQPAQAQMDSLVWLIQHLRGIYGQHVTVTRHSDHLATQCPGLNFPWNVLNKMLSQKTVETVGEVRFQTVNEAPKFARLTLQKLIDKGFLQGSGEGQGLDLSFDMIRIFVVHDRAGMYDR